MADEGQTGNTNNLGLSGAMQRQSWRPPAARSAGSLVLDIMRRIEPSMRGSTKLLTWYSQFIQRVLPWPGWSPMSMELGEPPAEAQGMERDETTTVAPAVETAEHASTDQSSSPGIQRSIVSVGGTAPAGRLGDGSASRRPAMRLAILRQVYQTVGSQLPSQVVSRSETSPTDKRPGSFSPDYSKSERQFSALLPSQDILSSQDLLFSTQLPMTKTRLVKSTSQFPRREVRGGFPKGELPLPLSSEGERVGRYSAASPLRQWMAKMDLVQSYSFPQQVAADVPVVPASQPLLSETSGLGQAQQVSPESAASTQEITVRPVSPISQDQSAIERLIEHTNSPVPLPGFEVRILSPEEQHNRADENPEESSDVSPTPPTRAADQSQQPQVDIDKIADRVYQTLTRRQQLERERKGLY